MTSRMEQASTFPEAPAKLSSYNIGHKTSAWARTLHLDTPFLPWF